jgi:glycosyltransferase involved in cell wall biosynthesis
MSNTTPLVSVIIPTYNQAKYIEQCVESCLGQTYPNLEIIVVDDGCTDSTPEILSRYGSKIRVITQKNQGAAKALNNGIHQSNGNLICWLSSDDAYLPSKIQAQVELALADDSIDLIYTDWFSIDADGNILKEVKSPYYKEGTLKRLLFGNFINGSSVLMKKTVWQEAGGFNTDLVADVDGFMWHKLLLANKKFAHVPQTLIYYRTHSQNQSSNMPLMRHFSDLVILNTLQNAPSSLFDDGKGEIGLCEYYSSLRKHLNACFFWRSSLYVSIRINTIKPSLSNWFQVRLNKFLISIFNANEYRDNDRINYLFKLRRLTLNVYHKLT